MIIVDKNKATMAGPDELIECEAMIFVEAVKRHFIKKHGENIGKEMFEMLLECSVMSDEEAEKRARENKNKPLKDYHIIAEKYRVLNGFKNVVIGVITGAVMLVNGWIEADSKAGQLLVALGMVILVTLMMHCTDEILNEQVD